MGWIKRLWDGISHFSVVQWVLTPWWGQIAAAASSVAVVIASGLQSLPLAITIPGGLATYVLTLSAIHASGVWLAKIKRQSFFVCLDPSAPDSGDDRGLFARLVTLKVKNQEAADLEKRCLIKIEEVTPAIAGISLPFVLRTDGQGRRGDTGRFTLSAEETKTATLLYYDTHRLNKWYLFDELGNAHYLTAQDMEMVIRVYGGKGPTCVRLRIKVGSSWSAIATVVPC